MKNSKIGAIIKNDFERSIKNKWFVILNVCFLIFTVIGLNFNTIKGIFEKEEISEADQMHIFVEDKDGLAYEKIAAAFEFDKSVTVEKKDSVAEFENSSIEENKLLVKVNKDETKYINVEILSKEVVSAYYIDEIEAVINSVKDTMIAQNKNLTKEEIELIKEDATIKRTLLAENLDDNEETMFLQIISNYLIFFVLLLCLNKIANTISQEKMSKSIEYILTSITTKEYMISKVLSMCLIVVVQFVFMLAYLLIAIMIASVLNMNTTTLQANSNVEAISFVINLKTVGYIVMTFVFMCLTTFLQGIVQSIMSAKTTNIQEAGNATILLVTLNLILYTVVLALVTPTKTVSAITYVISILPIASMYFIPAMFIIGQANIVQVIIALIILVASLPLSVILAQKPFKNAILDFTNKKEKKINGIEKILSTREYQDRMIERKESSKKGLIIGMSVILFIVLQLVLGVLLNVFLDPIANKITFISADNVYLIASCIIFVLSIYLPYLVLKAYMPKEEKQEISKEEKKASFVKCMKYVIISIPIISMFQMVCSFAVEKMGLGVNVTDALGLFNYTGVLSTILMFVQIAILPAIFEELYIRKGVMGVLKDKGAIFAVVISALIFATIHMNVSQFLFGFLMGILLGIVRVKTNRMYPSMLLHFINNGFAVISALFYNNTLFIDIFTYFTIALNAVGFCLLIYMLYKKVMELKDKESIQKLKEELDYRKIKLNLVENMYVFRDFTFAVTAILSVTLFIAIEKILTLM